MNYEDIPRELNALEARTRRAESVLHQHLSNNVGDEKRMQYTLELDEVVYTVSYNEKAAILSALIKGGNERINQLKILDTELKGTWEKLNAKR